MNSHKDLMSLLDEQRKEQNFSPAHWVQQKCEMLNDYLRTNHLKGCVVSVSGGVDSAVTYALACHAQGLPLSPLEQVLGICQPIHSTEEIWSRALDLRSFGGQIVVVDQSAVHDQLVKLVDDAIHIQGQAFAVGQMRSYQRTPVAYYACQLLSQQGCGSVVVGTGNYDEDGYLRYFCKAGDGISDVQLLGDLHKSEVFSVGRFLSLPLSILSAPPSADLWPGQTDEDELGFSYDFVELLTSYLASSPVQQQQFKQRCSPEGWEYFSQTAEKAKAIHDRNAHKAHFPLNLNVLGRPSFS